MLFSSPVFVFQFLPLVLAAYYLARPLRLGNVVLFLASLVFYAWGEGAIVLVMLASIAVNWALGLWVGSVRGSAGSRRGARCAVALAVVFNLGLLVFFKYANFVWGELGGLAAGLGVARWPALDPIHLPIGISFFTFQALSYVVDVYRRHGPAQRNPLDFGLYIAMFPQLVAGPIVRYRDVAPQISEKRRGGELVGRRATPAGFALGVRRFALGFAKKMLIANVVGRTADEIFALPPGELSVGAAWLGAVAYTLHIYFDFSGYSDMAIGLGHMFGFHFLENFRHPYVARSITDFWRRWHISLSSWFRDYLYIPLGGNRAGTGRTLLNLVIVFFLCGLWHGASWSFVVWGLYHGAFLVLERLGWGRVVERLGPLRHAYVLLVVLVGWVFFRADDLTQATAFLARLFGAGVAAATLEMPRVFLDRLTVAALAAGALGSIPWLPALAHWRTRRRRANGGRSDPLDVSLELGSLVSLALVFVLACARLSSDTYNPFIYFRF